MVAIATPIGRVAHCDTMPIMMGTDPAPSSLHRIKSVCFKGEPGSMAGARSLGQGQRGQVLLAERRGGEGFTDGGNDEPPSPSADAVMDHIKRRSLIRM
jgi:hypothetical protein